METSDLSGGQCLPPVGLSRETSDLTFHLLERITNQFSAEQKIGEGTYGEVYKGILNGDEIAVKKLYNLSEHNDEQQFVNKSRNLMKVQHKNIVKLVGYCYEIQHRHVVYNDQHVFAQVIERALCFEYCHNGSLQQYLSADYNGLDWPTRYKIIKGTCEGLKYLHGLNPPLYHLNIKPDNILLGEHMESKLSDFGLSRLFGHEMARNTILAKTTVAYVSPEYRHRGEISPQSDMYSIGVVMIEIVAGTTRRSKGSEMHRQDFIDLVRGNWRNRLRQTFRGSTLDAYCQQVERCTEIALNCMEIDRRNRPGIVDVTIRLNETETHEGFVDPKVWNMSFKELQEITSDFSEEIGKGAFGAVYKGKLKNGEVVAVKKLDHFSANQRKQIESEEHLKNLEHKNIVQLIGYCEETIHVPVSHTNKPGEYILVDMTESLLCYEFLSNGSLEDKMWKANSPALDWKTRHTLIQGICEGLHYLHHGCPNAPIVHRDLKPANILLDDDMVPKLGDFGLSRIVPETQAHTTAVAVGSCGYMAPETINHREITPKADIYSLGVLILEIITGKKCPSDCGYSGKHYVEQVREDRKQNSYVASRYPLLEDRFLQQVDSWISIGLRCAEELHQERPTIEHIIHFLETESAISAGTPDREVRVISFKEMEDITKKFSERQLHGKIIFGAVYEGTRVDGEEMTVIKLKEHRRPAETQFNQVVNGLRFEHKNILQLKGYCSEIIEVASKSKEKHGGEMRERLLCYEFLQNGSLDRKIFGDQSPLSWEERYRIIQDICQVLKYLHEECEDAPQVHMGITPGNIWLDNDMLPKVGCCGLSRLFAADPTQIYNTAVVGSWGYIAPEHIELTKISTKSDIYSLGVLIIEIVTGEKCPSNDNGSAESFIANVRQSWLTDSHIATKYPSLDAICIQQVKGCIKIGSRCTEIIPDKRPTAGEIVPMLVEECTKKPGFWNALCSGICPMEQL